MGRNLMTQIANYLSSQRRRKIGYWVMCSLGAVVVFCTTYALILPAITMSNEPICGVARTGWAAFGMALLQE